MIQRERAAAALGFGVLLGACTIGAAPVEPTHPSQAILYRDSVNVIMTDGALCAGHRQGLTEDWSGRLFGCAHLLPFTVSGHSAGLPARLVLRRTPGGDQPRVDVVDATGARHVFTAP